MEHKIREETRETAVAIFEQVKKFTLDNKKLSSIAILIDRNVLLEGKPNGRITDHSCKNAEDVVKKGVLLAKQAAETGALAVLTIIPMLQSRKLVMFLRLLDGVTFAYSALFDEKNGVLYGYGETVEEKNPEMWGSVPGWLN